MTGRWLIALYPASWRKRYGDEFAELLASQPVTPGMVIDIVAGAVDARLRPQAARESPKDHGEATMMTNLMKRCAAGGPNITRRDQTIGSVVMLMTSLVLALAYIAAAARYRGNDLVDAFGIMAFPIALTLALPFTYLKEHSRLAKLGIVTGMLALLGLASYLASLI